MRKDEFMQRLEELLWDIPEEERREALAYYQSYFEDAGEENEERILRELESPERVAQTIKAEQKEYSDDTIQYTERGYEDSRFEEKQEISTRDSSRRWKILLLIVVAVLTSPVWIGVIGGIFGGGMGLIGGFIGIAVAIVAVTASLYAVGITLFGVGIAQLVSGVFGIGLAMMGAGLLVLAVAVFATIACVWLFGTLIPWLVRGAVRLFRSIFQGRRKEA